MILVLAGLLLVPVLAAGFDLAARPTFRRLALRNLLRRRGEAALVVLGSLLGTAIITASFVVGDTLDASIRDLARTQLGPIDETASVSGLDALPELEAAVTGAGPIPGTDGSVVVASAQATLATSPDGGAATPRAEPRATVHEVDFDAARAFGGDGDGDGDDGGGGDDTGFAEAGPTPRPGQAVLGDDLASELRAGVGDEVELHAYGRSIRLEVVGTVPRLGLAGFSYGSGSSSPVAFLAPGTLAGLVAGQSGRAAPPIGQVFVSNEGGVFDGAEGTGPVLDELRARAGFVPGAEVRATKADLLEDAEAEGDAFAQLFTSIGGFSVVAGVLLLVNIFVMLAEDRKGELGVLRAVGLKRNHLVRTFALEGGAYALVAAALGALAGIGVGRVVVAVTAGLFTRGDDDLALRFAATPGSLLLGAALGLAIGLLTVWATSARIGRLNVVRAIRDLPEPRARRARLLPLLLAGAGMVLGGLAFARGVGDEDGLLTLAGPAVVLGCAVPVLRRWLPLRLAMGGPAALALAWGVLAFRLLPEVFEGSDIPLFVVQGVLLVGSAVALAAVNAEALAAPAVARFGPAVRLGLAYPLARRVRTGLLLGMYAIVVFTLTFLAVLAGIFAEQAPRISRETSAGYDLLVDSNPGNPVPTASLAAAPGVEAVAGLVRSFATFATPASPSATSTWALTGFGPDLLARGAPALESRSPAFESDEAAFRAVLADPGLALVNDFFLSEDDGPTASAVAPGEAFTVRDEATGEARPLTVAGVLSSDFQFNGVLVGADVVTGLLGERAAPVRHYVAVEPGADAAGVADRLDGDLLAHGVDAEPFLAVVEEELDQQNGFLLLMQGFLSLGLVIGIAGLGVVMVRAVRERRRSIGMLRALGLSSGMVRRAFLVEAGFLAAQGIVVGIVLGLVTSYTLLVRSSTFGEQDLGFRVPWFALAVILLVPLATSLVAAAVPASRAAAIRPAAALRIAD